MYCVISRYDISFGIKILKDCLSFIIKKQIKDNDTEALFQFFDHCYFAICIPYFYFVCAFYS